MQQLRNVEESKGEISEQFTLQNPCDSTNIVSWGPLPFIREEAKEMVREEIKEEVKEERTWGKYKLENAVNYNSSANEST